MKYLSTFLVLIFSSSLQAHEANLATYLSNVTNTDILKSRLHLVNAQTLAQENKILSNGFSLGAQVAYAESKNTSEDALEYQVSLQKSFLLGSSDAYKNTLHLSSSIQKKLQTAQIQNYIYQSYIDTCFIKEQVSILEDEKLRNTKMTALIQVGVDGGEFDLSSLYRSQMSVDNLSLKILSLKNNYKQSLQRLNLFSTKATAIEPQCSDLPADITPFADESFTKSPYSQAFHLQAKKQTALKKYRDSLVDKITVGLSYDDEMDVTRSSAYLQVPLTWGDKRTNTLEVAKQQELAAFSQQNYLQQELENTLASYRLEQQNNAQKLAYINDKLILKAYKTAQLMKERFQAGEANYLEYINSQQTLFDFILQTIHIRRDALQAQAKLYTKLGISPLKEQK
ncbi:TolC family protein [Sulfurimonas sp.]|uniref:TolC family protein n=1 Tax=Sulfurimonas sp. TaxID=2022749 RepID=UPI002606E034|nr:TolC family protein [Sulfurimonas sp.]